MPELNCFSALFSLHVLHYVCNTTCVPGTLKVRKGQEPLKLELWVPVSHHVGAESWTAASALNLLATYPALTFSFFAPPETGFLCVTVLAVLELTLYTRLALNSLRSTCLYLPSVGIKSVHNHRLLVLVFLKQAF